MMMMLSTCTMCPCTASSWGGVLVGTTLHNMCFICTSFFLLFTPLCFDDFFFLVFLPTLLERQGFQLYCSWAVLPHELLGVISVWAFSFEVTQPSGLPEDKQLHFQLQS